MADLITDKELDNVGLKFAAARELAKSLEPQLRAIEHSGEVSQTVTIITHRYGRSGKGRVERIGAKTPRGS